jgi:co-chaperonin GroES (HSP10)
MTIIPLGDKVIIKPTELPERTVEGIWLAAKQKPNEGVVIDISQDFETKLMVGDTVKYSPTTGETLDDGNILLSEQHIYCIIRK